MQRTELSRRRFIAIAAGVAALGPWPRAGAATPSLYEWRGVALGARATILLAHPDRAVARSLVERCVAEIDRLESIFSLYRSDSALCRLNAAGALDAPPLELVELLGRATSVSATTDGIFDATIQPLWRRYAEHYARPEAAATEPVIEDVLPLVDWRAVSVETGRIALARPGMALTLNGIAQGYITDRIADLLRRAGMDQVLVDLGETRALGRRPDGTPWRVGVADPGDPSRIAARIGIADLALATSGGYGTPFEPTGRHNHLIDPRTGRSAPPQRSVTVLARDATTADAAATALCLMDRSAIPAGLRKLGAVEAHLIGPEGIEILRA